MDYFLGKLHPHLISTFYFKTTKNSTLFFSLFLKSQLHPHHDNYSPSPPLLHHRHPVILITTPPPIPSIPQEIMVDILSRLSANSKHYCSLLLRCNDFRYCRSSNSRCYCNMWCDLQMVHRVWPDAMTTCRVEVKGNEIGFGC